MAENTCLKCAHRNICRAYDKELTECCNHFMSKNAVSPEMIAEKIFSDIEKEVTEIYNNFIFGNTELYDTEKEAVMDFCVDLGSMLDRLTEKYTNKRAP